MNRNPNRHILLEWYEALHAAYGPQNWWPADSPTEVVIGAILTQNTAWTNVEKAIRSLKNAGCLDFKSIDAIDVDTLGNLVRSAGTFRVKAKRLKAFAKWLLTEYGGNLEHALSADLNQTRNALLAIVGIGPETADAILLYAGDRPTFVVDAYTQRILRRHRLIEGHASYDAVKAVFEQTIPHDMQVYNEYHALLVEVGKRHCRVRAVCHGCPLERWPHDESL